METLVPKRRPSGPALLIRIAVLILALALFIDQADARLLLHLDGVNGNLMRSSAYWVSLVAPAFFLAALWQASEALVRMNRGEAFGAATVRGLKEMGACLMLGAFAAIILQPSLIFLFANGFTEMRGVTFDVDIENITLALVGLTLILLAREGKTLQAKLDEFV
jgi:hypothetical protein